MFKKCFNACLLALFISFSAQAQQEKLYNFVPDAEANAREHNADISHMLLNVSFEPEKGLVKGTVTHTFTPLRESIDSIVLDAVDIRFKEVKIDGKEAKYKYDNELITIYTNAPLKWETKHTAELTYEANPRKGIYFIGWNDSTNRSRKQIWTQGEEYDNRYWIPSFDHPADKLITEVNITMPAKFEVLSNGKKINQKKDKNGNIIWHYQMQHPHTLYLTMLGIGEYAVQQSKSKSGVPLNAWYYPDQPEKLEPTYRYTAQIMDFYEKEIGVKYPWTSYSQIPVQEFMYGAMENTTATVFGDFFYVDKRGFLDRNYVGVNAHEMAHQWFGDLISAREYSHQWLQESFATYYAKMAERSIWGEDYYQWNRRQEANAAINISKINQLPIVHTGAGSARIYQKGSFVLGMLKYVTGEAEYNKAVKYYLEKHAYKNVITEDFQTAFYESLGLNLDWFFSQWLYHGGEPNYNVHYEDATVNGKRSTSIFIDQTQAVSDLSGYFSMPIVVEVYYKDGTKSRQKEMVSGKSYRMQIPNANNKDIDFVLFDPNNEILKSITFDKTFEELSAQLLKAPNMLDRYDALLAMKNITADKKRDILLKSYNKESFYGIKTEIISQLAEDKNAESGKLLQKAVADKDVHVRLSALENTKTLPETHIAAYEKMLQDSSYKIVETALLKLNAWNPQKVNQYLEQTKNEVGMSKNIRISWLKTAIAYKASPENALENYRKELTDYASAGFEFRTRNNAFDALLALNYLDENAVQSIFDAMLSANRRLAAPAAETLNNFYKQDFYKKMIDAQLANGKWNEAQQNTLSKLLKK